MTNPATISWIGYGWETSYAAASGTIDKALGHGVKVTGMNRKNNIEAVYSCGYRVAQKLIAKRFEGVVSAEWILANPWFFKGVLGAVSDGGSAPYTHTFTEGDTIPSMTIANNIQSSAVRQAQLLGAVIGSCTLTTAVNELVRVRADMPYANENFTTSTSGKLVDSFDLYSFSHGTIEAPDGTTMAQLQNSEATINNNPEGMWGQGSRFAQEMPVKNLEHTATINKAFVQSSDLLEDFYGASTGPASSVDEMATMQWTFTNGLTGSNTRSIEMTWTGVGPDEHNMPQDPTAVIMEDVALKMRSLTVIASDNTQTSV